VPEPVSVQAQRPSSQLQSTLVWPVLNCALSVSLSFSHASALLLGLHCLQPLIGRFGWSQQSDLLIDWPSLGQRAAGRPAVACAPPEARNSANPINLSATNQSSQIWSSPLSLRSATCAGALGHKSGSHQASESLINLTIFNKRPQEEQITNSIYWPSINHLRPTRGATRGALMAPTSQPADQPTRQQGLRRLRLLAAEQTRPA